MTLITQENEILNYNFIRSIALFDATTDTGELIVVITAVNDRNEQIDIAAYRDEKTAQKQIDAFQTALSRREEIFRFADEDSDNNSYTNRFN